MNLPEYAFDAAQVKRVIQQHEAALGPQLFIDREMECGAVLLIASLRGIRAGCILQVRKRLLVCSCNPTWK